MSVFRKVLKSECPSKDGVYGFIHSATGGQVVCVAEPVDQGDHWNVEVWSSDGVSTAPTVVFPVDNCLSDSKIDQQIHQFDGEVLTERPQMESVGPDPETKGWEQGTATDLSGTGAVGPGRLPYNPKLGVTPGTAGGPVSGGSPSYGGFTWGGDPNNLQHFQQHLQKGAKKITDDLLKAAEEERLKKEGFKNLSTEPANGSSIPFNPTGPNPPEKPESILDVGQWTPGVATDLASKSSSTEDLLKEIKRLNTEIERLKASPEK